MSSPMHPETMTAVEITEPGGPQVLKPTTRPVPEPQHGQILIKVAAAGVNRPDVVQREGLYPPPKGASDLPGLEVAGTVVDLGPGVQTYTVGDGVAALLPGGGYAEYVVADAAVALPAPEGMTLEEAAALPETVFTVWTNVFERGGLEPGERILIHGGTSGIGTIAIQLASALGARVFATAGSAEKVAACERLGAEKAINYREEDFVQTLSALTDGEGVDVVLDMVGGSYVERNIQCLRMDGRLVQIAFLDGPKVSLNLMPVMLKRLTLTGSTLRSRSVMEKAALAASVRTHVWPLIESGRVKPVLDSRFALAEAAAAHERMESSGHIGKIMLIP
ncbi:MAG: NAD(P)H-quinone oxidoreductase [Alphaproteobacteria bacterium]